MDNHYGGLNEDGVARPILSKPFDKDAWLKDLAEKIHTETEAVYHFEKATNGSVLSEEVYVIDITSLQTILKYYFPQIKLVYGTTGDNTPTQSDGTSRS